MDQQTFDPATLFTIYEANKDNIFGFRRMADSLGCAVAKHGMVRVGKSILLGQIDNLFGNAEIFTWATELVKPEGSVWVLYLDTMDIKN